MLLEIGEAVRDLLQAQDNEIGEPARLGVNARQVQPAIHAEPPIGCSTK
jgi:hypothetical protein